MWGDVSGCDLLVVQTRHTLRDTECLESQWVLNARGDFLWAASAKSGGQEIGTTGTWGVAHK